MKAFILVVLCFGVGFITVGFTFAVVRAKPRGRNISHPMVIVEQSLDESDIQTLKYRLAWDMARTLVDEGYWAFDLQGENLILRVGVSRE